MRRLLLVALVALPVATLNPVTATGGDRCCGGHHGCAVCAQCGRAHGCPECGVADTDDPAGRGPAARRAYDPDTVTTLSGAVTATTVVPARRGRGGGTQVRLVSDGLPIEVLLGPTWLLAREELEIRKGDALEVTGSLVDSDGETLMVARELKKGSRVLKLRNEGGVPVWAAGGRR